LAEKKRDTPSPQTVKNEQ